MRRLQPRKKAYRSVPVPEELRVAMAQVLEFIREDDPDIDLTIDDCIQAHPVLVGGKCGDESRPFVLTYYPGGNRGPGKWFLVLSEAEIEAIAQHEQTELPMYCCTAEACGSKFSLESEHCFYCDYIEDGGSGRYTMGDAAVELEHLGVRGLTATATKADLLNVLGPPAREGDGLVHERLGKLNSWMKYRLPKCDLHIEIAPSGRIAAITIRRK